MRLFVLVLTILVLCSCRILPKPPVLHSEVDSPPELPSSVASVDLSVDLAGAFEAAGAQIPTSGNSPGWNGAQAWESGGWNCINAGEPVDRCGQRYRYKWNRGPLNFALSGNNVTTSTSIGYGLDAQIFIWPAWFGFACGLWSEGFAQASASLSTAVSLLPNWSLAASTGNAQVAATTGCWLKVVGIPVRDVSGNARDAFAGVLSRLGPELDGRVAAVSLRGLADGAWQRLREPIALPEGLHLKLNPTEVGVGNVGGSGQLLNATIGVVVRPVISAGTEELGGVPAHVPDLSAHPLGAGVHVRVDTTLSHDVLSKALSVAVAGKEFGDDQHRFILKSARTWGAGSSQIVVEVDFEGAAAGKLYLVGRPTYDGIVRKLAIGDLEFDIDTRNVLLSILTWLKHDQLRDLLKREASWPVGNELDRISAEFSKAANTDSIRTSVSGVDVVGIHVGGTAVTVRTRIDADVSLKLGGN
jgi:hypothetical protein